MTTREAFLSGREHLAAIDIAEPAIEAEILLRHASGWDRAELYARWETPVDEAVWARYRALLDERATGRPVHYIVGEREFMGLAFAVDERALIPRPETEVLVECVIDTLRAWGLGPGASEGDVSNQALVSRPKALVVDVGTGSGCIAVSVAHFVPAATVYATDIWQPALELAAENARRHGVAGRIRFLAGDLLAPLPAELAGRVAVIASNPPYVAPEQADSLPREIRDFEPAVALFGVGDGLEMHRRLVLTAGDWLRPAGLLAMEVGVGQAEALRSFLDTQQDYDDITVRKDYAGIDRLVTARMRL